MFAFLLSFQVLNVNISLADNPPPKEFRGVWIVTINNIDWPSSPGLPIEVQKKELRELIEQIERLNLNVVIFQVRPAADSFYSSKTEPWSVFLTGKQGVAPIPFFDPLEYAIELCHSKGMELHAWFNPFRVRNTGVYALDPKSFAAKNPGYLRSYDGKVFFDPGIPQVRNHLVKVVMEVVRKYDIDAIHFDDYFYPYPVKGKKFPDQKSFSKYGKKFYPNRLGDWRRENINLFVKAIHDSIKAVKPSLKLGIAPFGVWRNRKDDPQGSPGVKATTSYDDLYADVYRWLANDWVDYVIPQLYWEQGNRFGDFSDLAKWWNDHSFGKQLYLGQALYKSTGTAKTFTNPNEISQQISILRKFENVKGFALYSASHLIKLSAAELGELNGNLLSSKVEIPFSLRNPVIAKKEETQLAETSITEKMIANSEKSGNANPDSTGFDALTDAALPVPEQFKVVRSKEGWELSWETPNAQSGQAMKFTVLVFETLEKGGYKQRVFATTDSRHVFVPVQPNFDPPKVLYGAVSLGANETHSPLSKLFKIKRKRVVYF
ncbi:MAG: family 10 glycosylhydrolase [Mariniphaga sp.]